MKIAKKTSLLVMALSIFTRAATCTPLDECMEKISQSFGDALYSEIFNSSTQLNEEIAQKNKSKILALIAENVLQSCEADLPEIAETQRANLLFVHDGQNYAFNFSIPEMFEYIDMRLGIMVYNKRTKSYPDIIKLSDIPKLYWSNECSDHVIWDGLNNNAAINVAGQRVFSQYGGGDNEFFLDFEEGNNRRAFPGLVLMDKTRSSNEYIVSYTNFITGKQVAEQFAEALQNSYCSNQSLAVYLVELGPASARSWYSENKDKVATFSYAVAGALGFLTMIPTQIEDIQQVKIMAGPYNIN